MSVEDAMTARLGERSHVGGVRLQVSALETSLAFYRDLLGFAVLDAATGRAALGAPNGGRPLVTLVERRGARVPQPRSRLGLFHFAILLPDRPSLGRALAHLSANGVPLGMSDHLVSEALYLSDPDGLGIEIYRDRVRTEWQVAGSEVAMATDPLDVEGLLAAAGATEWSGMPDGTTIGHVHLHVGELAAAEAFYHGTIGFDVTLRRYPGALFLSAGGYHHHLGVNTWARGAVAPAVDEPQLLDWELVVAGADEVHAIRARVLASGAAAGATDDGGGEGFLCRDPSGTAVRVIASEASRARP